MKGWFNNHSRETSSGENRKKLLNFETKKKRKLALWQAYSQLYYDDKVKPSVESEWPTRRARLLQENVAGDKEPPLAAPLWFRTEITKALFELESQALKDEVEMHRADGGDDEGDPPSACDDETAQRVAKAWAFHR